MSIEGFKVKMKDVADVSIGINGFSYMRINDISILTLFWRTAYGRVGKVWILPPFLSGFDGNDYCLLGFKIKSNA